MGNFPGERFNGPERSPCNRDAVDRQTAVNGYTLSHVAYQSMKADQIRQHLTRNRKFGAHFQAQVDVQYYPPESLKPVSFNIVSHVQAVNW